MSERCRVLDGYGRMLGWLSDVERDWLRRGYLTLAPSEPFDPDALHRPPDPEAAVALIRVHTWPLATVEWVVLVTDEIELVRCRNFRPSLPLWPGDIVPYTATRRRPAAWRLPWRLS